MSRLTSVTTQIRLSAYILGINLSPTEELFFHPLLAVWEHKDDGVALRGHHDHSTMRRPLATDLFGGDDCRRHRFQERLAIPWGLVASNAIGEKPSFDRSSVATSTTGLHNPIEQICCAGTAAASGMEVVL